MQSWHSMWLKLVLEGCCASETIKRKVWKMGEIQGCTRPSKADYDTRRKRWFIGNGDKSKGKVWSTSGAGYHASANKPKKVPS